MSNYQIYKITSVNEKQTKKGDKVYSIQLNNTIIINNVNPDKNWKSSGKKNMGLINLVHDFWITNNHSLKKLVGKLIYARCVNSDFGVQFDRISSLDIINDFKEKLDESDCEAFITNLPIYDLLVEMNYKIENDNIKSIPLKKPYEKYSIFKENECTICYCNITKENTLTFDNIDIVYKNYYCPKKISSYRKDITYSKNRISIVESYTYYGRDDKISSSGSRTIKTIGNNLSKEEIKFLTTYQKSKK